MAAATLERPVLDWIREKYSVPGWDLASTPLPWDPARPALAEVIERKLRPDREGLVDSSMPLPDDALATARAGVPWSAGARDGVATWHMQEGTDPVAVQLVLERLRAVLVDGGLAALPALYEALLEHATLSWVDELAEGLAAGPGPDANRVYALGMLLAGGAPDREAVKAGIALLGLLSLSEGELGLLRLLACHDELALFAALAIAQSSAEPELELWAIARRSRGWGRVQCTSRLLDTRDGEIRAWLRTEGYANDVDDLYLAVPCATAGDLAGALEADALSDEELTAAARLFLAVLRDDGPMPGIEAWEQGPAALSRWLERVAARPALIPHAVPVAQAVLGADAHDPPPWTEADGARLLSQASAILEAWGQVAEA